MVKCKVFKTFKERGEWVELRFMTQVVEHGFKVLKPWGESTAYDVGVDHGPNFLRVQVKSTTVRTGTGYFCQFKPNYHKKQDYTLQLVSDPAAVILGPQRKTGLMLFPMVPLKKDRYKYEAYKEAWTMLSKSKRALALRGTPRSSTGDSEHREDHVGTAASAVHRAQLGRCHGRHFPR